VFDRGRSPARRRIELRKDDPAEADGRMERDGLGQAVLAGRRVEDEERLRDGVRQPAI
jgi:hypothetical protein